MSLVVDSKVSAIICTYNRYDSLIKAIESVVNQTYPKIEIIVVNDKSSERAYYDNEHPLGVKWIDLEKSSREVYGYPSLGYSRNIGIEHSTGDYVAFLDDDDIWFPDKITKQRIRMIELDCSMCCTEAYIGSGSFENNRSYRHYYSDFYRGFTKSFFLRHFHSWDGQLPEVFDLNLIKKHNFIIHSSVVLNKSIFLKSGLYNENIKLGGYKQNFEDWEMWQRVLQHTNCTYLREPLMYYDGRLSQVTLTNKILRKIKNILPP